MCNISDDDPYLACLPTHNTNQAAIYRYHFMIYICNGCGMFLFWTKIGNCCRVDTFCIMCKLQVNYCGKLLEIQCSRRYAIRYARHQCGHRWLPAELQRALCDHNSFKEILWVSGADSVKVNHDGEFWIIELNSYYLLPNKSSWHIVEYRAQCMYLLTYKHKNMINIVFTSIITWRC